MKVTLSIMMVQDFRKILPKVGIYKRKQRSKNIRKKRKKTRSRPRKRSRKKEKTITVKKKEKENTVLWNLRFWICDEGYEDCGGDRNNSE